MNPFRRTNTIQGLLVRSWVHLALSALVASITIAGIFSVTDYRNQRSRILDDLSRTAPLIARRLSGELLLGQNASTEAVIGDLKSFYKIPMIYILPEGETCPSSALCKNLMGSIVSLAEDIPSLSIKRSVLIAAPGPTLWSAISLSYLALAAIPVLLMTAIGIYLQWRLVRRKVLQPIHEIIDSAGEITQGQDLPVEIEQMANQLKSLLDERDQAVASAHQSRSQALLGDFVECVWHDIQTPLVSGVLVIDQATELSISKRDQLKSIIERVRAIIKDHRKRLTQGPINAGTLKKEAPTRSVNSSSLGGTVASIINEYQAAATSAGVELLSDIPRSAFGKFIPLSFAEHSRVLANILENAIYESSSRGRKVIISVSTSPTAAEVVVRDFGRGFSSAVLQKLDLGEQFTDKPKGNGIGLVSARRLLASVDGQLALTSLTDGASVRVTLPLAKTPSWFVDVTRTEKDMILALDDDPTLGDRLGHLLAGRSIRIFEDERSFLTAVAECPDAFVLVDHHFGGSRSGLDLIIAENLASKAVLLSGRISFDESIRDTAEKLNVRLCPKECLG